MKYIGRRIYICLKTLSVWWYPILKWIEISKGTTDFYFYLRFIQHNRLLDCDASRLKSAKPGHELIRSRGVKFAFVLTLLSRPLNIWWDFSKENEFSFFLRTFFRPQFFIHKRVCFSSQIVSFQGISSALVKSSWELLKIKS